MSRRAGALALTWAAATVFAAWLTACGEKDERVPGTSRAEVRALVAAGLAAVRADAAPPPFAFSADGAVLRIRLRAAPRGGPLLGLAASTRGAHADVEPFCPKPALLRCRPSLRAWTSPGSRKAADRTAAALRALAARTYDVQPFVRRRGRVTRIVTANGELLAAVMSAGATVTLSFAGLEPPRRPANTPSGRLEVEAGPEALAAVRPELSPAAGRALAGVRRLVVSAPLPGAP